MELDKTYEYTISEYATLKKVHVQTVYAWKDGGNLNRQPDYISHKRIGTVWIIISSTPKEING